MSYPQPSFITEQPTPRPIAENIRENYPDDSIWQTVAFWIDHPRCAPYNSRYQAWMIHGQCNVSEWPAASLSGLWSDSKAMLDLALQSADEIA